MTYSTIQKSQLEGASRLDAEYYQSKYLSSANNILSNGSNLGDLIEFIKHPAEIKRIYQDNGVPFLLTQNLKRGNFILDSEVEKFISEKRASMIPHNLLAIGDVVMTRTGANYGDSAVYFGTPKRLLASAHILIIRPKKNSGEFLATFLNTKIGRSLVDRGVYGGLQPEITPDYVKTIPVPKISAEQDNFIRNNVKNAFEVAQNYKKLYSESEKLLLEELGLKDFEKENNLFSIVNLSEVQLANRIDAEYFQEKYKRLIEKISSQNFKKLGDLVSIKKGFEPGAEAYQKEGKSFIRVSNLTKLGLDDGNQQYLSKDLYNKLKNDFEPKIGEILLSKDATPGIAYAIKEPIEGIISSGILRLRVKNEIDSEYLSLVISSLVGKMQAERDAGGSIIAHWKPEQIKNILIPILPKETQQKIAGLVCQSHIARQKSKELLEEAKRKVEEMIEKG